MRHNVSEKIKNIKEKLHLWIMWYKIYMKLQGLHSEIVHLLCKWQAEVAFLGILYEPKP